MTRRTNGCEAPFRLPVIGAWIGQVLILVWYSAVAFGLQDGNGLVTCASVWTVLLIIGASCWIYCQTVDPSKESSYCVGFYKHEAHYCAVCKKSVPGIDHQ